MMRSKAGLGEGSEEEGPGGVPPTPKAGRGYNAITAKGRLVRLTLVSFD